MDDSQNFQELVDSFQRISVEQAEPLAPGAGEKGGRASSFDVGVTVSRHDVSPQRSPPPKGTNIFFSPVSPLELSSSPEPSPLKKSKPSIHLSPVDAVKDGQQRSLASQLLLR